MIRTTCDVCGAEAEYQLILSDRFNINLNDNFDLCNACYDIEHDRMWKSFNDHHNKEH